MRKTRPAPDSYGAYYQAYTGKVPDGNILRTLEDQRTAFTNFIRGLTSEQLEHRYAPGKWSMREVLVHIIDSERVFVYRALCFSRGEKQSLPGFDQEAFIRDIDCSHRTAEDLAAEFDAVRQASLHFFYSLNDEQWQSKGIANDLPMTTFAIAWIIAGHLIHHWNIFHERYLVPVTQ